MAAEDRLSGVGLQQEAASHIDPARLVGKWIEVEGLGLGQVVAFKKRSTMNPLSDSKHDITFTFVEWQQGPQTQSVLLRRRKLMAWNKGRRFHLAAAPAAPAAAPGAVATSTATIAPALAPVVRPAHVVRNADGTWRRPRGAARKNCSWDAIRGAWVPSLPH